MNQIFLKFTADKLTKLKETSEYFKGLKSYSQSDYWRLHESLSAYKFKTDGVYIQGESGHYYPRERNLYNIIRTGLGRRSHSVAFKTCYKILCSVRFDQKISQSPKISFPYHDVYDAIWSISPFVDYSENIERLDFKKVQIPKEFKNHKSLQKHWHLKDRFLLNSKFYFDFYNYFVSCHLCRNPDRVLEIGGGGMVTLLQSLITILKAI